MGCLYKHPLDVAQQTLNEYHHHRHYPSDKTIQMIIVYLILPNFSK